MYLKKPKCTIRDLNESAETSKSQKPKGMQKGPKKHKEF